MTNKLLFLCTGNFYRSRFAEICFNFNAEKLNLNWRADSRGFAADLILQKFGRISPHAINGLLDRGIPLSRDLRGPRQVRKSDLEEARLIIAVKESEHRPFMRLQFPEWVDRIEYWNIHDLDQSPAAQGLQALEGQVQNLIQRLEQESKLQRHRETEVGNPS